MPDGWGWLRKSCLGQISSGNGLSIRTRSSIRCASSSGIGPVGSGSCLNNIPASIIDMAAAVIYIWVGLEDLACPEPDPSCLSSNQKGYYPIQYVLGGFARGDEHAVHSATPHLFLLSFQILTENIISGLSLFSPPVRALVPLLYTVRRIFVLIDWIQDVWINKTLPANTQFKDVAWYWFGKGLAVANLVYFSINLFGFLIPQFLPRAFEKYFRDRNEVHAKLAEDKKSQAMNRAKHTDKKAH